MFRGNWCIILAAFGCIISLPPHQSARAQSRQAEQTTEQSLREIANALNAANKREEYNPECNPGEDNRRSDLCAQWKAADGTQKSAIWTERTFWLGVVGLVLGLGTLAAAVTASAFALRAARASERSLEDVERPWLLPTAEAGLLAHPIGNSLQRLTDDEPHRTLVIQYSVELSNFGKLPAIITSKSIKIGEESPSRPEAVMIYIRVGDTITLADEERHAFQFTRENREHLMRNAPPVIGEIVYRDQLGVERELGFALRPHTLWILDVERHGRDDLNYDRVRKKKRA